MDPIPEFRLQFAQEDGKNLIILDDYPGEDTPYYVNIGSSLEAFVRIGNQSVLADVFNRLGYMERQGSGLGKILDAYANAHNYTPGMEPTFFSNRAQFTVTLKNLNISAIGANDGANNDANMVTILSIIRKNAKATQTEISIATGIPRRTLQRMMKRMTDEGSIERIGGTRGYWKINE